MYWRGTTKRVIIINLSSSFELICLRLSYWNSFVFVFELARLRLILQLMCQLTQSHISLCKLAFLVVLILSLAPARAGREPARPCIRDPLTNWAIKLHLSSLGKDSLGDEVPQLLQIVSCVHLARVLQEILPRHCEKTDYN